MLYTPEGLKKKDSRIAFRTPSIVKKTLEWFAQKHMRSENQEAEVLILESLAAKAHELQKIFLEWRIHIRSDSLLKVEETLIKLANFCEKKGPLGAFTTFKHGAHKEDNPRLLDLAPKWLVFAMKAVGINPYEIPPGLYVFESELVELIGYAEACKSVDLPYREDLNFVKLFGTDAYVKPLISWVELFLGNLTRDKA